MDSKARLSEKSGYYLSDILLEKCVGVMRGDSRAADYSMTLGNDTASEQVGKGPRSWKWHFGSPLRDLCLLMPKHKEQIPWWKKGLCSWENWKLQGQRVGSHWNILIVLAFDLPFIVGGFAVLMLVLLFGDSYFIIPF